MATKARALLAGSLLLAACAGTVDGGMQPTAAPADPAAPGAPAAPAMPAPPAPGAPAPAAPPASSSAPPAAAPPAPAPAPRGILGCPTDAYPGAAQPASPQLSAQFRAVCATCHGAQGEGKDRYPAIPGKLDAAGFLAKVRSGTENMPPFAADYVPDAVLMADLQALRARGDAITGGAGGAHPSFGWSPAEVDQKFRAGLAVWRRPDAHGAACASCHSPDAIDLAVIAYPDDAIMRRGLAHLSPVQMTAIVDLVHAQRRRFGITRPCSRDWRPFQPGGEVLPGATPAEQERSFWSELQARGILVATSTIATAADAERAWQQLAALDLRTLRLGIPLPRWTEDRFDGDEHRSINDWMPAFPRRPVDGRWYQMVDAYLADPTDARLVDLMAALGTLTTDDGAIGKGDTASGDTSFSRLWNGKSSSVLLASHFFRMALLGRPGWNQLGTPPFATAKPPARAVHGMAVNPMREIGNSFQEDHCFAAANGPCEMAQIRALPPMALVELQPDRGFPQQVQFMTHPWWTLGMLFDPALTSNQDKFANPRGFIDYAEMQYWSEKFGSLNFPHAQIHRPFLFGVNFVKRAGVVDAARKAGEAPGVLDAYTLPGGSNQYVSLGFGFQASGPLADEGRRLVLNLMRMTFLRMRAALDGGAPVTADGSTGAYAYSVAGLVKKWRAALAGVVGRAGADAALVTDTIALADDLVVRLGKAQPAVY